MGLKQFFLIFLVCLAVFLPIIVLRPMPFGFDSYYYLNIVCNGTNFVANEPFLSKIVFSLLPCNIPLLISLNFLMLFWCCLMASWLGKKLVGEQGWLAGIFLLGSFVFTMSFFGIESEPFAYALIFTAAALFYSPNNNKKTNWLKKLVAILLVLVSVFFWEGAWLMIAAFALSHIVSTILLVPTGIIFFQRIFGALAPNLAIQENWFGYGLLMQGFLFISLCFARVIPPIFAPIAFFSTIAFINMKFAAFAAFFLAMLAAKQATFKKIGWLKWLPWIGIIVSLLFFWGISANLPPNQYELDTIQLAVKEANGSTICNQWGYGHLISFFGGKPSDKAGGEQQCLACTNCIMLAFEKQSNCRLLKGNEEIKTQIKVFKC